MKYKWILLIVLFTFALTIFNACGPSPTATPTVAVAKSTVDPIATETKLAEKIFATLTASIPTPTLTRTPKPTPAATNTRAATATQTAFPTRLAPQATAAARGCIHQSPLVPANWRVIICDAFTVDFNFWLTGPTNTTFATGNKTVANGKYHWDLTAHANGISRNFPDMDTVSDFYLTAETQMLRGPPDAWSALVFRWSQVSSDVPSDQYLFEVRSDRRFRARLRYNDQYTTVIDWTPTTALKASAANRLTVIGKGSHFDLYVNEQKVGQFDNAQLKRGLAGLAIGLLRSGDHAVFDFDNFEVRAP